MTVQVRPHHSFSLNVYQGTAVNIADTTELAAADGSAAARPAAYVDDVATVAKAKSVETKPNAPFSEIEQDQLFNVYMELGKSHPLWADIETLLVEELTGNDRTNFLAVLSGAGSLMAGFVEQTALLAGADRSLFLNTALRNGSGQHLENLIETAKSLSKDQFAGFLETANHLGRSVESLKARELQNFVAAVADNPGELDHLIEKMSVLDEADRALFLEAAASAGDELGRFIDMSGLLAGRDLTLFLENAAAAGRGLTHLLSLAGDLTPETRSDFLGFTAGLEAADTENFLEATQGDQQRIPQLMATTRTLGSVDRSDYLTLAADAGASLNRLSQMVGSLADDAALRSQFLSTAIRSEGRLEDVLSIAEKLGSRNRAGVFAFASALGFTDLTSFISAARDNTALAADLADTARNLDGKEKSHLLYAASLKPDHIAGLTRLTRNLDGKAQGDFLYSAANIPSDRQEDGEHPDAMGAFLRTTAQLTGKEREDFLARERMASKDPAKEYVYLKSVINEDLFEDLMRTGENIEKVMSDFDSMGAVQRDNFFSMAEKADREMLPGLISVMSRLDQDRSSDFLAYGNRLGRAGMSHLIAVADHALGASGEGRETFDRLMATVKGLEKDAGEAFLSAAAKAGNSLDTLMDLTNDLTGFLRDAFLDVAGAMADRGRGLLDKFLDTTRLFVGEGGIKRQPTPYIYGSPLPSNFIRNGEFQKTLSYEGFLKSTLFLDGVGITDSHMNDWFNAWRGIPRQIQSA